LVDYHFIPPDADFASIAFGNGKQRTENVTVRNGEQAQRKR
jgi:hypothetical protein